MRRASLACWLLCLAFGCQVISGEADREFGCEGVDCFAECTSDSCPCTAADCDVRCVEPPCNISCREELPACRLDCPPGVTPGSLDCRIQECEDEDEQLCSNGTTIACRAACP
jgi:hypothetical protein